MNKYFLQFFFIAVVSIADAQQWVEFTQQNYYKLFLNPASAGNNSELYTTVAHRSQYTFLSKRAIASQFLEFSMPVFKKDYGIGVKIINDFIGYQRYTSTEMVGAYHYDFKKSKLSLGVGLGLINLSVNGKELRASGGSYENELVIHNDESIPNINVGGINTTFSFGFIYNINKFDLGFAINNINSPEISLINSDNETNITIGRTINLHSSYVIELTKMKIEPNIHINSDFVKNQFQIGINVKLDNIYFGMAFRGYSELNNDAVIAEIGTKIKNKIRIGYSYDYNISYLNKSNFGSHEISLSYFIKQKFSTKSKGSVLHNPRFL